MKKIKQIDFYIQATLIVLWFLSFLFIKKMFFIGYFVVGAWHLVSLIYYVFICSYSQSSHHKIVRIIVVSIITLLLMGVLIDSSFFIILYLLLVIAPILAVYYTCICYMEVKSLNERPLAQLK